jgi:hypothetical protein
MKFDISDCSAYDSNRKLKFGSSPRYNPAPDAQFTLGAATPIVAFYQQPRGKSYKFSYSFTGRYGEDMTVNYYTHKMSVKVDNEEVLNSYSDINNFFNNGTPSGKYDITITNDNGKVDDMTAHTEAHISYTTSLTDHEAPSLHYLQFRDKSDNVCDRFDSSADGVIELYAGDYTFNSSRYYTCVPVENMKVEWAPYQSNEYTEMTVEEVPELFCMPGFGAFYRGSLSSVNKMSSNGWFDLRVTLSDAAGNYQEQVISPAFKVNALDAVSEVSTDGDIQVYVRDGAIVVSGVENPNIEVYNAAGSRVRTSGLTQGIYVVRVNGTAHKVFVK